MIISREEAYKWVFSYSKEQFGTGYSSITKTHNHTVDKLFDSIGSCGECIHWEMYLISSSDSGLCRLTRSDKKSNGYCDDFERKEDK